MNLLEIAQGLAKNVGLAVPVVVVTSAARDWIEFLQIANQEGEELARRVDWRQLKKSVSLPGSVSAQTVADDLSRLIEGPAVIPDGTTNTPRPLTRSEWQKLPVLAGDPRYYLLEDDQISFWPSPPPSTSINVFYQSKHWVLSNGVAGEKFMTDDDEPLVNHDLFLKGVIVRWRRQKGMDYADYEAEYEAALRDMAGFNERTRL